MSNRDGKTAHAGRYMQTRGLKEETRRSRRARSRMSLVHLILDGEDEGDVDLRNKALSEVWDYC